ncbi:NAD(P)-dependent oxidoreductase [Paenibacillus xanthanilyticus]|uniref:NAD(P)-dependent oxidoreductase n=1 Tax=Paenibacillus xanthanilyticus TaxID=1783531 RepID=A0ABV8K6S1_9BACL
MRMERCNGAPVCLIDESIILSSAEEERLKHSFTIRYVSPSETDLTKFKQCDAFLVHSYFPHALLAALQRCKYIGVRAHNADYVPVHVLPDPLTVIANIPPVAQQSVAEHVLAMMFYLSKQLGLARDHTLAGQWRNELKPGMELYGRKLGIIGNGEIGQAVARLGTMLGMDVLAADKQGRTTPGGYPLEQVLREADIISLHLPARQENANFIDRQRIQMMKKGAVLINTARGSILDYDALEEAMLSGHLRGVGLDVYPTEPLRTPLARFLSLPNVICTPHTAYYTDRTMERMNRHLIDRAIHYFDSLIDG